MELIIKISEEDFEIMKHNMAVNNPLCPLGQEEMVSKVASGIPLPKGHGRIADMDAAIKCIEEIEGADAIRAIGLIEWACGKRTIIEADKESED